MLIATEIKSPVRPRNGFPTDFPVSFFQIRNVLSQDPEIMCKMCNISSSLKLFYALLCISHQKFVEETMMSHQAKDAEPITMFVTVLEVTQVHVFW